MHGLSGRRNARGRDLRIVCALALVAHTSVSPTARAADSTTLPAPSDRAIDFSSEVEPILRERCAACHGPTVQTNGLRFDQRDGALRGGYSGRAILPHHSAESPLVHRVVSDDDSYRMPPAGPRLTLDEVAILRAWIDQGATWDTPGPADEDVGPTPATLSHWSFQPIGRPVPPPVKRNGWV